MMCTVAQLKEGISQYIEKELMDKIGGLRKWGLAIAVAL